METLVHPSSFSLGPYPSMSDHLGRSGFQDSQCKPSERHSAPPHGLAPAEADARGKGMQTSCDAQALATRGPQREEANGRNLCRVF